MTMTDNLTRLDVNQLVRVRDHAGTHTIAATSPSADRRLVDMFGERCEFPLADLTSLEGTPGAQPTHRVITTETPGANTASQLNTIRERGHENHLDAFGVGRPTLSHLKLSSDPGFTRFATIDVRPESGADGGVLSSDGLAIHLTVSCNLDTVAAPYDLIPVVLMRSMDTILDTIVVLTLPGGEGACNVAEFRVRYTLDQLARLARVTLPPGAPAARRIELLSERLPELGVRATWMVANSANTKNVDNHWSGGVDEKDGSGKIMLRTANDSMLAATERMRITSWNASEDLAPTRPVVARFPALLQTGKGKQMATTIEAETEVELQEPDYRLVHRKLAELAASGQGLPDYGVSSVSALTQKTYVDIYYEAFAGESNTWCLLKNRIVVRHRSVAGDPAGTFLLAVKGASRFRSTGSGPQPERIRLAAQVQLIDDGTVHHSLLTGFLRDVSTDNAVGRVLADAITKAELHLPPEVSFRPALRVETRRSKCAMTLDRYGTSVDISVDEAVASTIDASAGSAEPYFSIEFGVGHPALTVDTAAEMAEDADGDGPRPSILITRPYHVPQDLSDTFFSKVDYGQYRTLAVTLLQEYLLPPGDGLTPGGDKAATLATRMGLLG